MPGLPNADKSRTIPPVLSGLSLNFREELKEFVQITSILIKA